MSIVPNSSGNHYKFRTEFFGLPVPGNEKLTVEAEHHRWEVIENLLLASTGGVFSSVFEDGEYKLVDNVDGSHTVMLSGTGHEWALLGVLNGGLIKSTNPIIWENLKLGHKHWLYVHYREGMFRDPTCFGTTVRTAHVGDDIREMLLLAVVNEDGTIDTEPPGKVYGSEIAKHNMDYDNPHGYVLRQREIVTNSIKSTRKHKNGMSEDFPIYNGENGLLDVLLCRNIVTVDALTRGKEGVTVEIPDARRILMVTVQEKLVPGQEPKFALGEVVLDYASESIGPNKVVLYNSGAVSIPVRLVVVADF